MGPSRYGHPEARGLNIDGLTTLVRLARRDCVHSKFYGQAERAISNGKLNVLLRLHIRPIKLVVFECPC